MLKRLNLIQRLDQHEQFRLLLLLLWLFQIVVLFNEKQQQCKHPKYENYMRDMTVFATFPCAKPNNSHIITINK